MLGSLTVVAVCSVAEFGWKGLGVVAAVYLLMPYGE